MFFIRLVRFVVDKLVKAGWLQQNLHDSFQTHTRLKRRLFIITKHKHANFVLERFFVSECFLDFLHDSCRVSHFAVTHSIM